MDAPQNFRSAFNGFNREDVVNYISYISTRHDTELNELRSEAEELRARLAEYEDAASSADALRAELAESRETCASLEAALDERCRDVAVARDACSELEQGMAQRISEFEAAFGEKDAEIARLTGELDQLRAELELSRGVHASSGKEDRMGRWAEELNAYRRAESCERRARERVSQMYDQANGALAEASVRVEQTAGQISELAAKVEADVAMLLKAMVDSEHALADTAMTLGAIRPDMD